MFKEKDILADPDIDLLVSYFTGALRGMARWWLQAGMPYSPQEMGRRYVEITRDGFNALKYL